LQRRKCCHRADLQDVKEHRAIEPGAKRQRYACSPRTKKPQQKCGPKAETDNVAGSDTDQPEARKWSEAEPESTAQYDLHGGSGEQRERRHAHVARSAYDGSERVEEPDHDRAREAHASVQDGLVEDRTAAAERAQD